MNNAETDPELQRPTAVSSSALLERTIAELRGKRKMLMNATAQYLAEGKIKVANRCLGRAVKVRKDLEKLEAVRSNEKLTPLPPSVTLSAKENHE